VEDKKTDTDKSHAETGDNSNAVVKKKGHFKWILLVVFIAMFARVILFPKKKVELHWFDYESGTKLAAEQDKPIFIAFYKAGTRFCSEMWSHTYKNEASVIFIEQNFVPIFVDVDKQPELAREYEIDYYPTHFIKTPDNREIIKTRRGYDTPGQFRPFLITGLEKMGLEPK